MNPYKENDNVVQELSNAINYPPRNTGNRRKLIRKWGVSYSEIVMFPIMDECAPSPSAAPEE